MRTFSLPDLGEGLLEAEIVAWHVGQGEHVVVGQPLVSVETDKAVVEIPSPRSGYIEELHGAEGELVDVGDILVDFSDDEKADTGAVVGELPTAEDRVIPTKAVAPLSEDVKAAPAVRALARRYGVDLRNVKGTGPEAAITSSDIKEASEVVGRRIVESEPLRGFRRAMARRMAEAHAEVVPASVNDEADVDSWPQGTDTTTRLVRALVAACKAEPALNAWFDSADMQRTIHEHVDVGIAVDTRDGLIVPCLRGAENMMDAEIETQLKELDKAVQMRRVSPDTLRGQTITLSNFGAIGGRHATMVVVPPQVAIVGAGRIAPRAVVHHGEVVVRRILPLSLTFDHRAVTGGEAARFLGTLIAKLEAETRTEGNDG